MKARIYLLLVALCICVRALAGVTVTPKPGDFVLKSSDNTYLPGFDAASSRFKTLDACMNAGATTIKTQPTITFKCDQSTAVTAVANCEGIAAPKLYLTQSTHEDGRKYWDLPASSFTDTDFVEMANLYVHAPTWPNAFPNCWVRGDAPRSEWRVNGRDEPGKVFMERLEPGMPIADLWSEENSNEPVVMTPALKSAWDASCEERHRVKIYYDGEVCS